MVVLFAWFFFVFQVEDEDDEKRKREETNVKGGHGRVHFSLYVVL